MANPAIMKALETVKQALLQADGQAFAPSGAGATVEAETPMDAGEGQMAEPCPECEAGTCTNPEHMSDDDYAQMMEA